MNKHRWIVGLFDAMGTQFYLLNEAEWAGLQQALPAHEGNLSAAFNSLEYAEGCESAASLAELVMRVQRREYVIVGETFGGALA